MDGQHLRVVRTAEDARIVQTRAARNARIDKFSVDRSRFKGMPMQMRCVESQAPEAMLEKIRAEVTFDERLDALRQICALPKAIK